MCRITETCSCQRPQGAVVQREAGIQGTARLLGQTSGALMMTVLFAMTSIDTAPRVGLAAAAVLTLSSGVVSILRVRDAKTEEFGVAIVIANEA